MTGVSLKALLTEEEALQKSLLRLDFQEMQRQFSGKEPLWRDSEVMRDTFRDDPARESKLEASLRRLDDAFKSVQSQVEVRLHKERSEAAGCRTAHKKGTALACQRRRPCSAIGRTGPRSRPRSCSVEHSVPTISCPANGEQRR
ncbi:rab-6.2 [Symbiodinium pilosum]|uniref:Rab-6.2 protein n=1 Tax=Symbiodinium pilosum TaxID=2952 RepID=A0A812W196_SYMPI|nr:rab-6.2 [Symbiodinium pilosum]